MANKRKDPKATNGVLEQPEIPAPVIDNTNGHQSSTPGLEELFISPGRGRPDLDAEMLRGSEDRNELLARSEFTEKEIKAIVRETARQQVLTYGYMRFDDTVQLFSTMKISQDRRSRQEYVQVRTGQVSAMGQIRQSVKGAFKRYRTIDKAEIEN